MDNLGTVIILFLLAVVLIVILVWYFAPAMSSGIGKITKSLFGVFSGGR